MTDRDHFAAAALTGLLSGRAHEERHAPWGAFVEWSLEIADAMLAARGEQPQPSASGAAARPDGDTGGAVTLTDAERESVAWYAGYGIGQHADTLRGLLARAAKEATP